MDDRLLLVALLVFSLVFQAVWLFTTAPEPAREAIGRRLNASALPIWEEVSTPTVIVLRQQRHSRLPWLDRLLARLDLADGLSRELQRAGVPLRAGEFFFLQLIGATIAGLLGVLFGSLVLPAPLAALALAVAAFVASIVWLRWQVARRLQAFESDLADTLDRVAAGLRAGFGLETGLTMAARDGRGPCAEEFRLLLHEINLGGDLDEAFQGLLERVDSEDARLLATAVAVQRRTGGNLVEVLAQMSKVIRERQRLKREVRVITTAPRVSGYVVALLPVLTIAVMYLTSRYYVEALISDPIGRLAAFGGGLLVLIGLYLNNRIARVDY
jgi:tight adherence protein B